MKHTISFVRDDCDDDGNEIELLVSFEIDINDVIYLQMFSDEIMPLVNGPDDMEGEITWCKDPINETDVPYVPLARAERAEAERDALQAQLDAESWRSPADKPEDRQKIELLIPAV